ncbi:MAG: hypothetical protein HY722_02880, partial [Planctomycetes bacterium]|nr:hypothetical protein [Planctomycetota bacterium]
MATENERERMHGLPAPGRTPAARQDREAEAATVVSPPVAPGAAPAETAGGRPAARYVLGEEIGRGGLGRVVSALDSAFDREVALKLVHAGAPGEALARFRREARITGRLEHPHIVPAYDLGLLPGGGEGAGAPFLSMKRIRGLDMGAVIAELRAGTHQGPWTRRRLVEALRDVC